MEIQKSNELIAVYMGIRHFEELCEDDCVEHWWAESFDRFYAHDDLRWPAQSPPPYEHSWNWIMPVVRKLVAELDIIRLSESSKGNDVEEIKTHIRNVNYAILGLQIEILWSACVQAIQVINKIQDESDTKNE